MNISQLSILLSILIICSHQYALGQNGDEQTIEMNLVKDVIRNEEKITQLEKQFDELKKDVDLNLIYGLIGSVIAVGLSSYISVHIHRSQYSKEQSEAHLRDLKKHAVNPLLEYFDLGENHRIYQKISLKKREDVVKENYLSEYFTSPGGFHTVGADLTVPLMEDLLDNHYEIINSKWINSCTLGIKHDEKLEHLHKVLSTKSENLLSTKFDKFDPTIHGNQTNFPKGLINENLVGSFVKQLTMILLTKIPFENIQIMESQDKRSISLGHPSISFGSVVTSNGNIIETDKNHILEITKSLMNDAEVLAIIKEIQENYEKFRLEIDSLRLALRKITSKTVLKKRGFFKKDCEYLKEDI